MNFRHIAARQNNYNTVTILLIRGANVTATNGNEETPLDCATQYTACYKAIALNFSLVSVMPAFTQKTVLAKYLFRLHLHKAFNYLILVTYQKEKKQIQYNV